MLELPMPWTAVGLAVGATVAWAVTWLVLQYRHQRALRLRDEVAVEAERRHEEALSRAQQAHQAERERTQSELQQAHDQNEQLHQELDRLQLESQGIGDELQAAQLESRQADERRRQEQQALAQSLAQSAAALGSGRIHAGQLHTDLTELMNVRLAFERWHASIDQLLTNSNDMHQQNQRFAQIVRQMTIVTLNASIEAARAGVSGRGFAVVAEEMRSLSRAAQNLSSGFSNSLHDNDLITTATFQDIQAGGKMIAAALIGLERENAQTLQALAAEAEAA